MWHEYTHGKQTLKEISSRYDKSHVWVRKHLDAHNTSIPDDITPQATVIVPDTTFWGHHYGVTVFRSWNLRRNLWWNEVASEKQAHYHYGRKILEERGWTFTAAVVDGRRGLAAVFDCFRRYPRTSVPLPPNEDRDEVPDQKTEDGGRSGVAPACAYAGAHYRSRILK